MHDVPQSSTVRVRTADADDAQAIAAVFDAAVRDAWSFLGPAAQQRLFSDDDWNRLVADHAPPNTLIVAENDRGTIGFAAAGTGDGELFLLFVHPDQAGRGVGRRLLNAAHNELRAAGRHQVFLFVHERNTRAIAVYQHDGYTADGKHRSANFRGVAYRELRLVKPL